MSLQRLRTSRVSSGIGFFRQALALICVLTFSPLALATEKPDFKITLPGAWKLEREGAFEGYFDRTSKKKPTITFEKIEMSPEQTGFDFLYSKRLRIERDRARLFSAFGLEHYTIVTIEEHSAKNGHKYQVIQSRYQGPMGQDVQVYERQYAFGGTVFRVTYTEESPALNDMARVKQMLDNVQPIVPKGWREPASASETGRGVSTENIPEARTVNGVPLERLRTPNDPNYCTDIPEKDRFTSDENRSYLGMAYQVGLGGASCLYDQVKAILDLIKTGIEYADFDSETHQQINGAIATVWSELKKSPTAFVATTGRKLMEVVGEQYDKFWCYNLKHKVELFCNAAITSAMLYKLLLKLPLSLAAHEKIVAAVDKLVVKPVKTGASMVAKSAEAVKDTGAAVIKKGAEVTGKVLTTGREKVASGLEGAASRLRQGAKDLNEGLEKKAVTSPKLEAAAVDSRQAATLSALREVSPTGVDALTEQKLAALLRQSGNNSTLLRSLQDINATRDKAERLAKLKELRAALDKAGITDGKISEADFAAATKRINELAQGKGIGKAVAMVESEAPKPAPKPEPASEPAPKVEPPPTEASVATASENPARQLVRDQFERVAPLGSRNQILHNYDTLMPEITSPNERANLAKDLSVTKPEKIAARLEAEMRKRRIAITEAPAEKSVAAVPAEMKHPADAAKSSAATSAKPARELTAQESEVSRLLTEKAPPGADVQGPLSSLIKNTIAAEREAIMSELQTALASGDSEIVRKAVDQVAGYKSAYGSAGTKPQQFLESLRKLNGKSPEGSSSSGSINWNAMRGPDSPESRIVLSSEARSKLSQIRATDKAFQNAERQNRFWANIEAAEKLGKSSQVDEILKTYRPAGLVRRSNFAKIEKAIADLSRGPTRMERFRGLVAGYDPVTGFKTSRFKNGSINLTRATEDGVSEALRTLATGNTPRAKMAENLLESWNNLTPEARKAGVNLAQKDPNKFLAVLDGYVQAKKTDPESFITAAKSSEFGLGTSAPAATAAGGTPEIPPAPATGVRGAVEKTVNLVTEPPGTGTKTQVARAAAIPATVYQNEKQANLEQQAATGFDPDDNSPQAMYARMRNDSTSGRSLSPDERTSYVEGAIIAAAAQAVVSRETLEEQLKKLSEVPNGKHKNILEKYHRLLKKRGAAYADKLIDLTEKGAFREVIKEIEREGKSPQAAKARRPAAGKTPAKHHAPARHHAPAKHRKPVDHHSAKPKKSRSHSAEQKPASSDESSSETSDDGDEGG